jgi:hypothetical protein
VANLFGGIIALRILGVLVAVISVLLLTSTARRAFGDRAATVTAVAAAALLATPLYGAIDVNGELMALPFLALGLRAATEAVLSTDEKRARISALVTGVAAMCALLVKQNIADVLIFAAVFWLLSWRLKKLTGRQLLERVGFAAIGAVIAYAVVMLWAIAHGTSPVDVYDATYPFRVKAARVIADNPLVAEIAGERLGGLGRSFITTGAPLIALLFAARGIWKAQSTAFAWALVAIIGWSVFSVLAGGSYWTHYLVESIPAAALAIGSVAVASPRLTKAVIAVVAASTLVAGSVAASDPPATPGTTIGDAFKHVKQPGDTLFAAFGDAEILRESEMTSPYQYLWSLPARTLDPKLDELRGILNGPEAPTWVIIRGSSTKTRLKDGGAFAVIESRYHLVGKVCDREVYLLDSVVRDTPNADDRC